MKLSQSNEVIVLKNIEDIVEYRNNNIEIGNKDC